MKIQNILSYICKINFFLIFLFQTDILSGQSNSDYRICPKSNAQWQRLINEISDISDLDDFDYARVQLISRQCRVFLRPKVKKCLANSIAFAGVTRRFLNIDEFPAGLATGTLQYFEDNFPEQLEPPNFLKLGLAKNWQSIVEECKQDSAASLACREINNYTFLKFDSSITPSDRQTRKRVLVFVPGKYFDRWFIYFPLADRPMLNADTIIAQKYSFVKSAGQMTPDKELSETQIYYLTFQGKKFAEAAPICFRCHSSGMRKIIPTPASVTLPRDKKTLAMLNARIHSYGMTSFGKFLDVRDIGPELGAKSEQCTACHSVLEPNFEYDQRNPITVFALEELVRAKMGVHEFVMPKNKLEGPFIKNVKRALSLLDQLSSQDLKTVRKKIASEELVENGFYRTTESVMQSREFIFDLLEKRGLLRSAGLRSARNLKSDLSFAHGKQSLLASKLLNQQWTELILWLKGGRENCAIQTEE